MIISTGRKSIETPKSAVLITDGAAGKPWVYRYKDLRNWWSQPHYNRQGGIELSTLDTLDAAKQADLADGNRMPSDQ